jgi:hypothetical protein
MRQAIVVHTDIVYSTSKLTLLLLEVFGHVTYREAIAVLHEVPAFSQHEIGVLPAEKLTVYVSLHYVAVVGPGHMNPLVRGDVVAFAIGWAAINWVCFYWHCS